MHWADFYRNKNPFYEGTHSILLSTQRGYDDGCGCQIVKNVDEVAHVISQHNDIGAKVHVFNGVNDSHEIWDLMYQSAHSSPEKALATLRDELFLE